MVYYSEKVELLPAWRRAIEICLGSLGALATLWTFRYIHSQMKGSPSDHLFVIFELILILLASLQLLHEGVFYTDHLEINDDSFTLNRGLVWRQIPLKDVVEAKAVRYDTVRRVYLGRSFPWSLDGFFLVRQDHPHVRLLLTGAKTLYVATQRPAEMAEILGRGSQRSMREGVLRLMNS